MRKNKLRLNTGGTAVLTLLQYAVHRLDYFLLISVLNLNRINLKLKNEYILFQYET